MAKGVRRSSAKRPAIRLSMSTAAAPVAMRSSALARAVETGELTAGDTLDRQRRAPASVRRRASDEVTASSAPTRPSAETTSAPRMRSPGRSRGSSPPHTPQLTTRSNRVSASFASLARRVGPSPQIARRPGPAEDRRLALQSADEQDARGRRRGRRIHRRTASPPATSRSVRATSSPARRRRRRPRELKRTRHVGSPGRSPCR